MPTGTDALAMSDPLVRAVLLLGVAVALPVIARAALRTAASAGGSLGRRAASVTRALRPGIVRRVTATVLGLGVPLAAALAEAPSATASAAARPQGDLLRRPVVPDPGAPGQASAQTAPTRPSSTRAAAPAVVVRPGDTLWDIARRHLPPSASSVDVAHAWPRWYAANRAVIGPDPALLRPGTRLRVPDRRSTGTSASSHHRPPAARTDLGAVARSLDPDRR